MRHPRFVFLVSIWLVACASEPTPGVPTGDTFPGDASDVGSEVEPWPELPSDASELPADSSELDLDSSPACFAGVTRCNANAFERCVDGVFTLVEQCTTAVPCMSGVGCAQCDPSKPTVCSDGNVHACSSEGLIGSLQQSCVTEPCFQGRCGDTNCAPETQVIYVIDDEYNLLSFDPKKSSNRFTVLAKVNCPASNAWSDWGGGKATPFSMSVDRDANAWVLYTSGQIFKVDPESGACAQSGFSPGVKGFQLFGMGFVSDAVAAATEKLFISGGAAENLSGGDYGVVDPYSLSVTVLGPLPSMENSPELTGTGNAKLFAYFPGRQPVVAELNKSTGAIAQQWSLPSHSDDSVAWAFATWAGDFYIFETVDRASGYDSRVLHFDPDTRNTVELESELPWIIVGAGVSTCAPWN